MTPVLPPTTDDQGDESGNPARRVCWYCCRNPALGQPAAVRLYRINSETPALLGSRFTYERFHLDAPRCPVCESRHGRNYAVTLAILVLVLVASVFIIVAVGGGGGWREWMRSAACIVIVLALGSLCYVIRRPSHPLPPRLEHMTKDGWKQGDCPQPEDIGQHRGK
jgi:hypothetical protein